jgi:lipopolysaccharide transport system ATP-binding protein
MTGTGDLALHDIQGNHEESIAMMQKRSYNSHEDRWGDNRAKIVDYVLSVSGVIEPEIIESRDVLNIKCYVEFNEVVNNPVYGIDIRTLEGIRVYGTNTNILPVSVKSKHPGDKIEIIFSAPLLLSGGDYFISIGISELDSMNNPIPVERRYDFINIKIQDNNTSFGFGLLDMKIKERVN